MDDMSTEPRESIQFAKGRDAGAVFGDSWEFVRQEFKEYNKSIVFTAGPIILVGILLVYGTIYFAAADQVNSSMGGFGNDNPFGAYNQTAGFDMLGGMLLTLIPGYLILLVGAYVAYVAGLQYMRLYNILGRDNFTWREVASETWADKGRQLGVLLLGSLMTFVGYLACIIPGLYLIVPANFAMIDRVFRPDVGIGEAFSEGFRLTKDRWWSTFVSLFLVSLGQMGVLLAIMIAFMILTFLIVGLASVLGGEDGIIGIILMLLMYVIMLGVYAVFGLGAAQMSKAALVMTYFSAREHHGAESLFEEVENMDVDDEPMSTDGGSYTPPPQTGSASPDAGTSWQRPETGSADDGDIKWKNPPGTSDGPIGSSADAAGDGNAGDASTGDTSTGDTSGDDAEDSDDKKTS